MKIIAKSLGAAFVLIGAVWFLQGVNILPGSFMTGHIEWAVYGGIAIAVGLAAIVWGRTAPKPR